MLHLYLKVKVTLEQTIMGEQRWMVVGGQCHTPPTWPLGMSPSTHCTGG
jgi:hypothetical protein